MRRLKIDDLEFTIARHDGGGYYVTAIKGQIRRSWLCRNAAEAVDMARDWLKFQHWHPQPYYQR